MPIWRDRPVTCQPTTPLHCCVGVRRGLPPGHTNPSARTDNPELHIVASHCRDGSLLMNLGSRTTDNLPGAAVLGSWRLTPLVSQQDKDRKCNMPANGGVWQTRVCCRSGWDHWNLARSKKVSLAGPISCKVGTYDVIQLPNSASGQNFNVGRTNDSSESTEVSQLDQWTNKPIQKTSHAAAMSC